MRITKDMIKYVREMVELAQLGSGERFRTLSSKLAKKGAENPDALAAWIGRKKYGKKRFAKLSARGK